MKQVFILPADRRSPSGGNLYNRLLLKALREAGAAFSVMTLEGAMREARRGRPTRYWLDSLLLDHMPELRTLVRSPSECFVVVHYFPERDAGFREADGFLVPSAFAAGELSSRKMGDKPVVIVPPAPAVAPGPRVRKKPAAFRALMAANVVPGKGVLEFLQDFGRHLSPDAAFSLEIAGRLDADRGYAARCRRAVEESAALRGKVRFLGALGLAAMKRAYERNAFFVSASRMETFGMALAEARVFGLYVLALHAGNAAKQVALSQGEIHASISALAERAARLAADDALRKAILAAMAPPPRAATWAQAAARFLAQVTMPQRRAARNISPPRRLLAAMRRPAASSRSRTRAHAAGMSPRGTKVQ